MDSIVNPTSRENKNTMFTVLSSHRRRYVLYACNQAEGSTTLSAVAEQVAAWEYDKPIAELTSTERKRIYTSIQQHHLSKLAEAGLVTVEGDKLTTTETARRLDLYLEIVPEKNIPWAVYYLGLAVIGGFSLGFAHVGWLPDAMSVLVVSLLLVSVLAVSASAHLVDSNRMRFDSSEVPAELDADDSS